MLEICAPCDYIISGGVRKEQWMTLRYPHDTGREARGRRSKFQSKFPPYVFCHSKFEVDVNSLPKSSSYLTFFPGCTTLPTKKLIPKNQPTAANGAEVLLRNGASTQSRTNKGQLAVELCSVTRPQPSLRIRSSFLSEGCMARIVRSCLAWAQSEK